MRLMSMEIENVRCFRQAHINLSSDITVIYGRNGVGKTALFDAIEYCLLNDVGRFAGESYPPDYIANSFSHEDVRIHIDLLDETEEWIEIVRDRQDVNKFKLSGSRSFSTHKDMLYGMFVNEDYLPPRREIELIKELVRSTILLSQATVSQFVQGSPEERARIVTQIAGSAYIQRCLEKARAVTADAIKRKSQEVQTLKDIQEIKAERTKRLLEADTRANSLRLGLFGNSVSLADLEVALRANYLTITSPEQHSPESLLDAVRSAVDARLRALEARRKGLVELETQHASQQGRLARESDVLRVITQLRKDEEAFREKRNQAERSRDFLYEEISKLNQDISTTKDRVEDLEILQNLAREREILTKSQQEVSAELTLTLAQLSSAQTKLAKQRAEQAAIEHEMNSRSSSTKLIETRIKTFTTFDRMLASYGMAKERAKGLEAEVKRLSDSLGVTQQKLASQRTNKAVLKERVARVQSEVTRLQLSSNQLEEMLVRIKLLATNEKCPLCGHKHKSLEHLHAAIDRVISRIPADFQKLAEQLQALSAESSRSVAEVQRSESEIQLLEDEIGKRSALLREAIQSISQVELTARSLGLAPSPDLVGKEIQRQRIELENESARLTKANDIHASILDAISSLESEVLGFQPTIDSLQDRMRVLDNSFSDVAERVEIHQTSLGYEASSGRLEELMKQDRASVSTLEIQHRNKSGELGRLQRILDDIDAALARVGKSIQENEAQLSTLKIQIEAYRTNCELLGLRQDESNESISQVLASVLTEIKSLDALIATAEKFASSQRISILEEEMKQVRQELAELEKEEADSRTNATGLDKAEKTATGWVAVLEQKVDSIVSERLADHRPEILNLFRRMVPNPFSFEEIGIQYDGFGINLGLRYRGLSKESGEPRFFLSAGQANVLALSIFLSLASKQNWSKLEMLLLDDPVQHLDDLDALAFIDTLRAYALGIGCKKKQIVVSTCDRNLYLLMIRKLGLLEAEGLRLTGISLIDQGIEGPEIRYDIGGPERRKYLQAI